MVDVLVSPGVPKPWLACRKEPSVLRPGFISAGLSSSSSSNLKRSFPFGDYLTHSADNRGSSLHSSPSRKHPRLHSRRHTSRPSTHCPFRGDQSNMSDTPLTMHHYPAATVSHCCSSERRIEPVHRAAVMPSYTDFMAAPAMKTTASSSGSSISESEHNPIGPTDDPLLSTSIATTVGLAHSMLSTDAIWAFKAPSFGSNTEDTPSVSSSFDFMDVPKQEQTAYHGLHLYNHRSTGQVIDKPFYVEPHDAKFHQVTFPESTSGVSWCEWPASGTTEPWVHEVATDEQFWTSTEYLSSCWPGQEPLPNTGPLDNPALQTSYPHHTIPLSSIDHLSSLDSTSTPPASQPEPENSAPLLKYLESHPHPQPQPHAIYPSYGSTSPSSSQAEHTPLNAEAENKINIKASLHYSDTRNAFLIECKRRGLSYKDIKRIGGFKEAESTLRGRFRTLTKAKEHRVRKPKWQDRDIHLLCEAVTICSDSTPSSFSSLANAGLVQQPPRVSWKKVAQYIWGHGGSYQFGNATCKKKWCEIHDIEL